MSKALVVVESPAKCKTIKKYLGKDFEVLASYGHVRDLLPKEGAVDPDNNFCMKYRTIEKNSKHVDAIVKSLKKADILYLATDPDREGEAISWHLHEMLKERGSLKDKDVQRIVFNEITKKAVNDALAHPRALSYDLVNAQQTRRALDYLVGFNLSPLLWKKIRRGLSAGRVQSPALRLIVERQAEIEAFEPQEYWTLEADLEKSEQAFNARLTVYSGHKLKQFDINNGDSAGEAKVAIEAAAQGEFTVVKVEKKQRKRNPAAPFITSTLQQEAARKLGFTALRTMRTAQKLYEGIDIGEGEVGLITYMRTDSVNLSHEALDELRLFIAEQYGQKALPKEERVFKTKSKNAQEAHEAIRPSSVYRTPDQMKKFLIPDQFKLYKLIWQRTVACQMVHATINTVAADLNAGEVAQFRANGSSVVDPGFMAVYLEGRDDESQEGENERMLPDLHEGDLVALLKLRDEQHFTEPPPAFTEASLIKTLEEFGIGRPSTYATIISTLQQREYVEMDKKKFRPTDLGRVVNRFLTQHFTQYVDYDFTAHLEDDLDAIARGEREWLPLLDQFWQPFHQLVEDKMVNVDRKDVTQEAMDEACPKCGQQLSIRLGRRGRFIGCNAYPECDYTRSMEEDGSSSEPELVEGRQCPQCESDLVIKKGRYGKFIGCSAYPNCKFMEPLEKPEDTQVMCPSCQQGNILKRKSRHGKIFFSCERYPECNYALWNMPLAEPCPECHWPILTVKTTKRRGTEKVCPQKECKFSEAVEDNEVLQAEPQE